jgi:cytochrome c6
MKKVLSVMIATISLSALIAGASIAADKTEKKSDGGNSVNAAKTLHKKDRDADGIKKPADIIAKMRNPGPGMTQFDKKTIPDKAAQAIAEYITKTFK